MGNLIERSSNVLGEPWIFAAIILCMGLMAYVHNMYPARFDKLFKATFNERMTRQVMREEMVFSHRASLILLLVSASSFSLVCTLFFKWQDDLEWSLTLLFTITFLAVCLWVLLRQGLRTLLSYLVDSESGLVEFNFVSALIYKALGFILLPVVMIIAFFDQSFATYAFIFLLGVLLLATLFRFYRGLMIGRHYKASKFYMIVYLCALELIPTLVLFRVILSNVEI
ncbi:MAG: DUF4271 domain-containing protein [Flavobacteriales bacterium]|nr:DUF4271 domain-containing protein [Flavobacteriales bacterium]